MFRYSLRTLFIGISAIAVFLAIGLPWLRRTKEGVVITTVDSIEEITEMKNAAREIDDRRSATRTWMATHGFQLTTNSSHESTDRFFGRLPRCGEIRVLVHYQENSHEKVEARLNLPYWIWNGHPVFPMEIITFVGETSDLVEYQTRHRTYNLETYDNHNTP